MLLPENVELEVVHSGHARIEFEYKRKYTEHVTECCTGMTKNSAYITINNGLQRLNYAYMREDNTHERESNCHKHK